MGNSTLALKRGNKKIESSFENVFRKFRVLGSKLSSWIKKEFGAFKLEPDTLHESFEAYVNKDQKESFLVGNISLSQMVELWRRGIEISEKLGESVWRTAKSRFNGIVKATVRTLEHLNQLIGK